MAENKHQYLKNKSGQNDGFKKTRGFKKPDIIPEEDTASKVISASQKDKLRRANALLYSQRKQRREEKSIQMPITIDFVGIDFFAVFNFDLQKKFFEKYGLSVVEYSNFNKSVLFEIANAENFKHFVEHLELAFKSPEGESYEGKEYNLIALINNFKFIAAKNRLGTITESGYLVSLVTSSIQDSIKQKELLFKFCHDHEIKINYSEKYPEIIEANSITRKHLMELVKNYDIIKLITSSRSAKIRPGVFGEERREYGFDVVVPDNLPVIGIIDSGVTNILPLRDVLTNINFDHTGFGEHYDELGHGTMVAGLVVFGDDFQRNVRAVYEAKARIAVIKPIHFNDDDINIPRLLDDIKIARTEHGVRVFNMSLNLPIAKKYNDSFSAFAYELDRLSYEEDILILMSVGNYDAVELEKLLSNDYHPSHDYPSFFYDLNSTSPHHDCWFTNIQEPSESLNNLSIGALSGNLEGAMNHDITPASEYPAYYTRKFHYDYSQPVNGTQLKRNQSNKNLNKPDLVFEGGDLFAESSGMEIIRSPMADADKFFGRACGTSLATPLVTSMAAEILKAYPSFRTQTVKALLINNAIPPAGTNPPDFQNLPINLYSKLTGFGKTAKSNLITTDNNTIVFVIEDSIEWDDLRVIPVKIPDFIAEANNKLRVNATLCYSFLPLKDNHLSYLPLHISFGIFKNVTAEAIAKTPDASTYRIKNGISWSEDFFGIENRLLSNAQRITPFNLQPYDLKALNNEISIAIRCVIKNEIPESMLTYLKENSHSFSIVISFSEVPELNASNKLYQELTAINTVEDIAELDNLLSAELEAEGE